MSAELSKHEKEQERELSTKSESIEEAGVDTAFEKRTMSVDHFLDLFASLSHRAGRSTFARRPRTETRPIRFNRTENFFFSRKIDIRLLLVLGCTYAISLIDRTNISVARVAGMGTALQLQIGDRYSIITL